jgi:hypothetical protein
MDHFDCHSSLQIGIESLVDSGHASLSQDFINPVATAKGLSTPASAAHKVSPGSIPTSKVNLPVMQKPPPCRHTQNKPIYIDLWGKLWRLYFIDLICQVKI